MSSYPDNYVSELANVIAVQAGPAFVTWRLLDNCVIEWIVREIPGERAAISIWSVTVEYLELVVRQPPVAKRLAVKKLVRCLRRVLSEKSSL